MSQVMSEQAAGTTGTGAKRTVTGTVVSSKMQKTIAVSVERLVKHPRYSKYVRRTTRLLAHDENGEAREGDVVDIAECRRLSSRKAWRLVRVVKRAGEA
jgi:small subunit ribosomal protein S17